MVVHYVYVVLEFYTDGPVVAGVYDNNAAAQACVEAGRAAGLHRWFITPYLQDEYESKYDFGLMNVQTGE